VKGTHRLAMAWPAAVAAALGLLTACSGGGSSIDMPAWAEEIRGQVSGDMEYPDTPTEVVTYDGEEFYLFAGDDGVLVVARDCESANAAAGAGELDAGDVCADPSGFSFIVVQP
jgi:hypothetical protein